ncbi:MAG: hypothetical protein NTW21_29110 [Verrucomicrobia bacterium]|nr:hypothetical protein [Verrucomicrobiota bacterium]
MKEKHMKKLLCLFVCPMLAVNGSALAALGNISGVNQRPWIIKDNGVLKSATELTVDVPQGPAFDAWVKISVTGRPDYMETLGNMAPGKTNVAVHVLELDKDGDNVTFSLFDNANGTGTALDSKTYPQQKIRHWRLYVGHNSHMDIGYTAYQEDLKDKIWPGFWDKVMLTDMPNSDTWPDDSKVRLEVEGTFQLDTTLVVRSADWFETLRTRLAEGRFAYGVAFGNMAHNNWGAEELARSTYYAGRFLKDKTGVASTRNVIMRDEPTLSWGVIDAMVDAGARSFAIHHNSDHNPWRGTTVYPELFYAQGRNPANKLLVWNSPVENYCVDELGFRDNDVNKLMANVANKLMGYQSSGGAGKASKFSPALAVDGICGEHEHGEWASQGEQKPWLRLNWSATKAINRINLYDRPNGVDDANGGTLSFSDGSTIAVTGIPKDGMVKEVTFSDKTVTWVEFKVTGGIGANVGLSEIQVFAGPENIAATAAVTASSAFGVITNNHKYPYDVAMINFTNGGDNGPMVTQVYDNIKALNDKGYVYPRIIDANYNQFFDDVASNWSASIPTYKGTIEDWWNFGAASTAYETGLNRGNHDKLGSAEFLATIASVAVPACRYPYEALARAYENLMLYDEHTWGSPSPAVDEQWRWKRNTAIASDAASDKVLKDSLGTISTLIPAQGKSIVVFNSLSWSRSDLVTVSQGDFPAHFDLSDVAAGKVVKYQKLNDGTMVFVAAEVPGLGYRTFRVIPRSDDPVFQSSVKATGTTLENSYFKVTFNSAGNIIGILDKQNGNAEMVDSSAPYPLNQYVIYKEGALAGQVDSATLATSVGSIMGSITADGATTGLDSLKRKVILYDSLARMDIVNDVVKGQQIANIEMGYFAFPLNVANYMLRHEMPTGDMRPGVSSDINDKENEQYYTSSTAFYTVNRWIDVSNQRDWGISFASLQAPLVSYGKPDIGQFKQGWDVNYNAVKPWIYSMVFNNEWQTNFQKTQPGRAVFRYSLRGHSGGSWQAGNAETFGAEVASPLRIAVIPDKQEGKGFDPARGQLVSIDKSNVVLTTAKMAEANGVGIIVRFNELKGLATPVMVDLNWFAPTSVIETDLIENDKAPMKLTDGRISFTIPAFGFKTVRLTRMVKPEAISGLAATFDDKGCQVTWTDHPAAAYFEVFRSADKAFKPGAGTYLTSVSVNHYYDQAVRTGLGRPYYYAVRAVQAGEKGAFTPPVQAVSGTLSDTIAPSAPVLSGQALHSSKVTLSWQPATDNFAVKGYRIYRDGVQLKDVVEEMNSWLDTTVAPDKTYHYTVKAYDAAGNLSAAGNEVVISTGL